MKKLIFAGITVATVVMIVVMAISGKPLKTQTTPAGILNLELATNITQTKAILHTWKSMQVTGKAIANTRYDFIFLLCYSAFFYLVCKRLSRQANLKNRSKKFSDLLSSAAILAGILDIMENTGMLLSLSGTVTKTIVMFTFLSSVIKWLLVSVLIIWIIMAVFQLLMLKFKRSHN